MAIGLIGRKRGMTRVFTEDGVSVPVTVVEVTANRVTQIKNLEVDGYRAVQVSAGSRKASRVNKPQAGHYKKAGVEAGNKLWEFRLAADEPMPSVQQPMAAAAKEADESAEGDVAAAKPEAVEIKLGDELPVTIFESGQVVDVVGRSIGKGYAGVIKRHNFSAQRATHGNSKKHRAPGAIGQNQSPGRVFKGKKMSGHMGDARTTVQNLEVVRVDAERKLLLIRGGVPGAKGADVVIQPATKIAG